LREPPISFRPNGKPVEIWIVSKAPSIDYPPDPCGCPGRILPETIAFATVGTMKHKTLKCRQCGKRWRRIEPLPAR
jgi:hypothetical protein